MSDTDRTDIIPGLRVSDTPPLGLPVPEGRHRARRGAPIHRAAVVAVFGAPAAAVMLMVGLLAPGWLKGSEASPARVAPSPSVGDPSSSLDPVVPPPVPTQSRADRSRPRATRTPVPAPSSPTARRSSSPTPTPTPTPTSSTPRPSSPSPTGSTPSPTSATPTSFPPLPTPPEPTDG